MNAQLIGLYAPSPGSGKTEVANALTRRGFHSVPFALPLKQMVASLFSGLGYGDEEIRSFFHECKEDVVPAFGVSTRHLLQTLGTEWGRTCVSPDMWLNHWRIRVRAYSYVVVDDVRFLNEAELIRSMGGVMWRVDRAGHVRTVEHESEGGLNAWPHFDRYISNDGTLQQLKDAVAEIPLG